MHVNGLKSMLMHYKIQFCCRNILKEVVQNNSTKHVCLKPENDPYIKLNMKHSSKKQKYEKNVKCMLID
jgi:hypothetical protein